METSVTFVVIAFNESLGIVDCINSIINQDVDFDYLICLVDDGSTDGTSEIVESTFSNRVRIIRQMNLGRGAARLAGINSANTEYIAMVDSDIRLPSNWLSTCIEGLGKNHAVGGVAVPDGDCATIGRIFRLTPRVKRGSINLMGSNSFFRADVLRAVGSSWVTRLGEDFRLQRLIEQGGYRTSSIPGLVVDHKENKSFVETIRWFFQSGSDATTLWLQYRQFRLPDFTFLAFLLLLLFLPFEYVFFGKLSILIFFVFFLLVGCAHINSKFVPRGKPIRFIAACIPNAMLMSAYLLGRLWGLVGFVARAVKSSRGLYSLPNDF